MKANADKADKERGGKKVKVKKSKKHQEEREEKVDKKKKSKKQGKEKKAKGNFSETVQKIVDGSRYKKFDGKLKPPFIYIAGKKALFIAKPKSDDDFVFRLRSKVEPGKLGLNSKNWKKRGGGKFDYVGDVKKLAKSLRIAFRKFQKANSEE